LSLAISLDAIQTPSGRRGAICVVRDMTERNKMEENLRSTQKLEGIGLLAGGIAHDFNNLLTGVLANASLALEVHELPARVRTMLEDVVVASERAADLTNQLLAYAGKGRVVEQLIDLSAIVRETLRLLRTSLVTISVELNLDSALPPILADATQIRQVLMNLIVNAGEAIGKRDGVISITTRTVELNSDEAARLFSKYPLLPGYYVSIEVKDTGTGMDEATLARIFDPFFTTKFIGRGLGLSATLGIVQGHKGAIRVLSAPGAGSCFEVMLPVKEIAVAKLKELVSTNAIPPKAATILVIDDEASVRTMIKTILELDGHTVLTAEDGHEGLRVFKASGQSFDIVLVDLTMPVMGGDETIKALRGIDPLIRIAVCTGHSESEAAGLSRMGISGVIRKPFRGSFLRSEVAKYLVEDRCTSAV
jgi:signal transduction histidine kinase/CheY-like chemotaxis protein